MVHYNRLKIYKAKIEIDEMSVWDLSSYIINRTGIAPVELVTYARTKLRNTDHDTSLPYKARQTDTSKIWDDHEAEESDHNWAISSKLQKQINNLTEDKYNLIKAISASIKNKARTPQN